MKKNSFSSFFWVLALSACANKGTIDKDAQITPRLECGKAFMPKRKTS